MRRQVLVVFVLHLSDLGVAPAERRLGLRALLTGHRRVLLVLAQLTESSVHSNGLGGGSRSRWRQWAAVGLSGARLARFILLLGHLFVEHLLVRNVNALTCWRLDGSGPSTSDTAGHVLRGRNVGQRAILVIVLLDALIDGSRMSSRPLALLHLRFLLKQRRLAVQLTRRLISGLSALQLAVAIRVCLILVPARAHAAAATARLNDHVLLRRARLALGHAASAQGAGGALSGHLLAPVKLVWRDLESDGLLVATLLLRSRYHRLDELSAPLSVLLFARVQRRQLVDSRRALVLVAIINDVVLLVVVRVAQLVLVAALAQLRLELQLLLGVLHLERLLHLLEGLHEVLEVQPRVLDFALTNLKEAHYGVLVECVVRLDVLVDEFERLLGLWKRLQAIALNDGMHLELDLDVGQLLVLLLNLVLFATEVEHYLDVPDQVKVRLILRLLLSEVNDVADAEVLAVRLLLLGVAALAGRGLVGGGSVRADRLLAGASPALALLPVVAAVTLSRPIHATLGIVLVEENVGHAQSDGALRLDNHLFEERANSNVLYLLTRRKLSANEVKVQRENLLDVILALLQH